MMTNYLDLPPLLGARGQMRLPGSKSLSNRALLLAALAQGQTEIQGLLISDDTERMLEALTMLGVRWHCEDEQTGRYRVEGVAGRFPVTEAELFLGNAGTAFRPLTAVLALQGGHYRLSGVARMHERPIGDLVDALQQLGADIRYGAEPGYPPLQIFPGVICEAGTLRIRGDVSSQFLSALLMALPLSGEATTIEVMGPLISRPYVGITLTLMAQFGVLVSRNDAWTRFGVPGGGAYRSPGHFQVEGDASTASYFLAAAAIGGGPVRVDGIGQNSVQGDIRFVDTLALLGARIEMGENWITARAPEQGRLQAFDLDLNDIPDAAMTLAVVALFADGPCHLRNIASWRVKETDRLAAMANELRKCGADVVEEEDGLRITPPARLMIAEIETYDDHRMAMCFSLLTLGGIRVRILDPNCVNKTFPSYFSAFAAIGQAVPVIAIDGPSASGKGTVAQAVAQALNFVFLDSGALYRLVALAALRRGVALEDEVALAGLAAGLDVVFQGSQILLNGEEVSELIRAEACSAAASTVAALPAVRGALIGRQRDFRRAPGLVADGRDMASTVFPDAKLKFFLTANVEVRTHRRHKQLIEKGMAANICDLFREIQARDTRDAARAVAPLQQQDDALLLDTSHMTIEEVVSVVLARVREEGLCGCSHTA